MTVPDEILKSVVFVGCKNQNADNYFYFGTAFYVGVDNGRGSCDRVFLVTARHVIDKIRGCGADNVCIRINLADGSSEWQRTNIDAWHLPNDPTVDVAIIEKGIPAEQDQRVIPNTMFITDATFRDNEVGLGDEVLITGLFRYYKGTNRNTPIVRIGNLACIAPDRIQTKNYGEIVGHLIEVRSMGGLSGSPVFLNLGRYRVIQGQLKIIQSSPLWLMGLVHGHFEGDVSTEKSAKSDIASAEDAEKINVGIAVVVPITSIWNVIVEYLNFRG